MKNGRKKQEQIHLGAHGEDYGNWMPLSVLGMAAGAFALMATLWFFFLHSLLLATDRGNLCRDGGGHAGAALMVHLDQAAVCLRGRRHDGAGPPNRPLSSGF